jgi:hypothetical protein
MIYERITKGFWGRYFFYLSVFVAVYFLMREKVDELVFGLLGSWIVSKHYPLITIFVFSILLFYPFTRIISKNKRKPLVDASLVAYLLIPVSVWFTIQMGWESKWVYYFQNGSILIIVLWFTIYYLIVLLVDWFTRPKIDHSVVSLLLKDEPIDSMEEDRLGFSIYAESIATNIRNIVDNRRSFVFGIEGRWGSGKTSFINLVKENLKKDPAIIILDFNPWKSSSVQQMTIDFFNLMAENVSEIRLKAKFREYGKVLATADGTGVVGHLVDRICPNQDLGTILDSINDSIIRRDLRFVVIVDDIDRMDKEEMLAVFKLVRNTASFHQTVFALTFDRDYVDAILKSYFVDEKVALSFPDKIVNFQFKIPEAMIAFYEILKGNLNDSVFIKKYPNIRLGNDIPENIISLFDDYRKVKRVFNSLVIESAFPHFEKTPVKYMLVFFYISYYKEEEYEMIKNAYWVVNGADWVKKNRNIEESKGKAMWRQIHESKGIYSVDKSAFVEPSSEKKKEENAKRTADINKFTSDYPCLDFLLNGRGINPFIKYLEFLFKNNAIHYKDHLVRYEKYGVDGFKGVELKMNNSSFILSRLLDIRKQFSATFYNECSNELLELFTRGSENSVKEKDPYSYYEFMFSLLLNNDNPINYGGVIIRNTSDHYDGSQVEGVIIKVLRKIDGISGDLDDFYVNYYREFREETRLSLVSICCNTIIKYITSRRYMDIPFTEKTAVKYAVEHLEHLIEHRSQYDSVNEAFIACSGMLDDTRIDKDAEISSEACSRFKKYIEQEPDGFVGNCIKDYSQWEEISNTSFHPFLMQIFNDNKNEVRRYFNNVMCKSKKSLFMLDIIRKYLEIYLSDDVQGRDYLTFPIDDGDYGKIIHYSDEDKEVVEKSYEPIEQTLLS